MFQKGKLKRNESHSLTTLFPFRTMITFQAKCTKYSFSSRGLLWGPIVIKQNVFAMFISTVEMYILNLLLYAINHNVIFPICMIFCYPIQIEIVVICFQRFIRDRCPVISMHVWFLRVDRDSTIKFSDPNHQQWCNKEKLECLIFLNIFYANIN